MVVFAPTESLEESEYTYAEAVQGEVGSTISLNAVARWESTFTAANAAAGTVTSVYVADGAVIAAGDVLYTVDLQPIAAAVGEIPAFRDLMRGASGPDVAQLQQLLSDLGHYAGPVDGGFGPATERAVRSWERSLGATVDGIASRGSIIFLPALPARVTLNSEVVAVGAALTGGETVVGTLAAEPVFTVPVSPAQAALVPTGAEVRIQAPNGEEWVAVVDAHIPAGDNTIELSLSAPGDEPVCAESCDVLEVIGDSMLSAGVVTVPTVQGTVVPTAALWTGAGGDVAVTDRDGQAHTVTVIQSANGLSVVEGVPVGMMVRVPGSGVEP